MNDEIETPEPMEPHPFDACGGPHLIPRNDPHCSVCDRGPDDEIHSKAKAA